jgi:hypothetical protein
VRVSRTCYCLNSSTWQHIGFWVAVSPYELSSTATNEQFNVFLGVVTSDHEMASSSQLARMLGRLQSASTGKIAFLMLYLCPQTRLSTMVTYMLCVLGFMPDDVAAAVAVLLSLLSLLPLLLLLLLPLFLPLRTQEACICCYKCSHRRWLCCSVARGQLPVAARSKPSGG